MDLILCHTTADFDALGAAVGLTRLLSGARIVLTGGAHPAVRDFLALHRDEYALIERRSVNPKRIRSLTVVDTQQRDRLGKAAEWLDLPDLTEIVLYDHHLNQNSDIPATQVTIEAVGATTTLIVEQLQKVAGENFLTSAEATVMALGIHVDTGSLTFDHSTPRDAAALAWLMTQGASLPVIAEYIDPGLSRQLQQLLTVALDNLQTINQLGYTLAWSLIDTPGFVPGLSSLASRLIDLTESDVLLLAARHKSDNSAESLTIIGRSRIDGTDLNQLFQDLGGGGHSQAASLTMKTLSSELILQQLIERLKWQIPHPPTARELMSSPVRTIRPETTIKQAQRILLRYGHSGLSVVDANDRLVGIISRRDIDIALHHGFSHAPVKGYMTTNLKTISPDTPLPEIELLMVTYDIGRLPVLEEGQLVGIVTRTDVLRQLHQENRRGERDKKTGVHTAYCPLPISQLRDRLTPPLWKLLQKASHQAEKRGWHLYLVGGAVRDLLLADRQKQVLLEDIDLVVDGFHKSADVGAGVELAKALQNIYPGVRLEVHGQFQTAALLWHKDPDLGSLWIDIATARTEFYPYPAANPEVEASSIRQDLYRRDFTINALAMRLTKPRAGELLDFFGGLLDLQSRQIRVLHANSFIEDPTRIYRAVRFAVRLGFEIEPQTEGYIRYAIASGIYEQIQGKNGRAPALETRLKSELKYILQAPYWKPALQVLANLEALRCIHPTLELDEKLWWQVRLFDRCLQKFDPQKNLEHWQMRLEVLIAYLAPEFRGKVANNLQLPLDSIERLQNLDKAETNITESLPELQLTSEIFQVMRQYNLPTLILIAVRSFRKIRQNIWRYLTELSQIKAPLNGNDLKALGYKPGKQFKEILDALLTATLDDKIDSKESAEAFIAEHFPLSK
ncbi:CBS domain-containing protein [Phormidium sp. LEGE 05292]|uniref:CBS domain-containing protein n=1 Tax=[Phormidium] sp. LEGE 05292 TaxID=767427 RepID=UPI0018813093|nr:CBS domain-containing protein [Phormidium sp. LEGE 05292]MBE9227090.1 CBS domain-containing protein [Phormidium sp. LEGE 05292]